MEQRTGRDERVLSAEEILERLTVEQFVWPHKGVLAGMKEVGVCPACGERALAWLGISGMVAIGRLRRTELTQLARATGRLLRVKFAAA